MDDAANRIIGHYERHALSWDAARADANDVKGISAVARSPKIQSGPANRDSARHIMRSI